MSWWTDLKEKFNPAQPIIATSSGSNISSNALIGYKYAFNKLESVNRGVSMVVSACASLDYDVKEKKNDGTYVGIKVKTINNLLNYRVNPYQSVQEFRTNVFTDFILEGNAFIYYDGAFLYHLPAINVEVLPD